MIFLNLYHFGASQHDCLSHLHSFNASSAGSCCSSAIQLDGRILNGLENLFF